MVFQETFDGVLQNSVLFKNKIASNGINQRRQFLMKNYKEVTFSCLP